MLEASQHDDNSFVTLTYANCEPDFAVCPEHVRNWLKRLRKLVAPRKFRYFVVGEYGSKRGRPHYHAALFGLEPCTDRSGTFRRAGGECGCPACSAVRQTWGYGHIQCLPLETGGAQYIAGYVAKKLEEGEDRRPGFWRMSLKPGLGATAMSDVASAVMQYRLEEKWVDVPSSLRHGGAEFPLGRYLRRRLRAEVGRDVNAPPEVIEQYKEEFRLVWDTVDRVVPKGMGKFKNKLVVNAIHDENVQPARNAAARSLRRRK